MNPSELIDKQASELTDWRGDVYKRLRTLINSVDPTIKEEWKWGSAVWTHNGLICSLGVFKNHLKIHFFKGAFLEDKDKLFNAGLDAKTMRAIDFQEGSTVDEEKLQALVKEAVSLNVKTVSKK